MLRRWCRKTRWAVSSGDQPRIGASCSAVLIPFLNSSCQLISCHHLSESMKIARNPALTAGSHAWLSDFDFWPQNGQNFCLYSPSSPMINTKTILRSYLCCQIKFWYRYIKIVYNKLVTVYKWYIHQFTDCSQTNNLVTQKTAFHWIDFLAALCYGFWVRLHKSEFWRKHETTHSIYGKQIFVFNP